MDRFGRNLADWRGIEIEYNPVEFSANRSSGSDVRRWKLEFYRYINHATIWYFPFTDFYQNYHEHANQCADESSDVKRGQNLEAETEAEARALRPRPRSRPELWGQGRGRGQFLEVEAKAEAKDKVMNKKYQMMVNNIQANLYQYDQNNTVKFLILSLAQ